MFDNPCAQIACPDGLGALHPSSGQSSLPPSNMAHTATRGAGVSLPMRTRVTGNVAWSLWLQNENFLPHTIDPTIAADPGLQLLQRA